MIGTGDRCADVRMFVSDAIAKNGRLPTLRELHERFPFVRTLDDSEQSALEGLELADHFLWRGTWRRS